MKRLMLSVALAAAWASAAHADMSGGAVKIGVLTDQSGVFSSLAGQGSVVAAQMAIEDFGDKLGVPVELVSADHQNKADVGTQIARQWYDVEGVDLIAVSNRSRESSEAVAREFDIPHVFDKWQDLIASPDIDAVVIGTWPNTHCEMTCAALEAGKHVLVEARMARNRPGARPVRPAPALSVDPAALPPTGTDGRGVPRQGLCDGRTDE